MICQIWIGSIFSVLSHNIDNEVAWTPCRLKSPDVRYLQFIVTFFAHCIFLEPSQSVFPWFLPGTRSLKPSELLDIFCVWPHSVFKSWWRHQIETFSALLDLCAGNPPGIHRSPVDSPHKGQWRGSLMFPLICAWTTGWANHKGAGDLIRHRARYDVTVMKVHGLLVIDRETIMNYDIGLLNL